MAVRKTIKNFFYSLTSNRADEEKTMTKTLISTFILSLLLVGCGSSSDKTSSDTTGDTRFKVTLTTQWNATDFETQYPASSSPHWSPLSGTVHNVQVKFWETDQLASAGIESMAETGSTTALESEIQTAKESAYSQGLIKTSSIGSGAGETSIEFATSDAYPLLTLVSMIAPSPDWFVGVHDLALQDSDGNWINSQTINLKLYDAGTDLGTTFTSANSDSSEQSLTITPLSSQRLDSDFEDGVHFSSDKYVATLLIEKL